jgi:hypothetical protein
MPNFTSFPLVVDNSPAFAITNLYIPRQPPVPIFSSIQSRSPCWTSPLSKNRFSQNNP